MVKRYITQGNLLMEVNRADGGCWVNLVAPTLEECVQIAQEFQIDLADVRAALDDEESSRVDVSNEYSLILFDVPSVEYRHQREAYTTIPLGLILVNDVLLTVCAEATPVLKNFLENTVKEFSTKKQMRFIYQIFLRSCMLYQSYLRIIDRKRKEIEAHIGDDTEEMELIDLHELESNLVYFDTSLRANTPTGHVLPDRRLPISPAFRGLPASTEKQLPLPLSTCLFPSVRQVPLYNACRKTHSSRLPDDHLSCRCFQEFRRFRISSMPAWICRYGYHGRLLYSSLLLYFRLQPQC